MVSDAQGESVPRTVDRPIASSSGNPTQRTSLRRTRPHCPSSHCEEDAVPHRPHEGPTRPAAHPQRHEPPSAPAGERDGPPEPTGAERYLGGPRIVPARLTPDMSVADLIDGGFQAYNAGRINEAARLYASRMLHPSQDVTICPTVAGAMTPAGVGGSILTLM